MPCLAGCPAAATRKLRRRRHGPSHQLAARPRRNGRRHAPLRGGLSRSHLITHVRYTLCPALFSFRFSSTVVLSFLFNKYYLIIICNYFFSLYLILHVYTIKFDVIENFDFFFKLNKASFVRLEDQPLACCGRTDHQIETRKHSSFLCLCLGFGSNIGGIWRVEAYGQIDRRRDTRFLALDFTIAHPTCCYTNFFPPKF